MGYKDDKRVKILAHDEDMAATFEEMAERDGLEVTGTIVWEGIVPPGSYVEIGDNMRMSTPEFYLLRMVAANDDETAMLYVSEMLGRVVTSLTCDDVPKGFYKQLDHPRLTILDVMAYIIPVVDSHDARRMGDMCADALLNGNVDEYERMIRESLELSCVL